MACLLSFPSWGFAAPANTVPIALHVDLSDAPRHLLHSRLEIPVKPGPIKLEYPKWIPGNHRPTGPVDNVTGIVIRANGKELQWRRDDVDMYGLHVTVPEGVSTLEVAFDFLVVPGGTGSSENAATSSNMAVLEWNCVVMYPANIPVAQIPITPHLKLPEGWKFGSALTVVKNEQSESAFAPVSVEKLVDSPLITGRYFREIALAPEIEPKHYLDVAGEAAEDVDIKPAQIEAFSKLVRETGPLYASRHYESYHFLLSLSDIVRGQGLEHHQSSDNGIPEHGLSDESQAVLHASLLPHEFTHSWNGKYRRPIGLATPDYDTPMKGDLLWVYEGMTQYWGNVLAVRSGLWTPEQYKGALAATAAELDNKPGRLWRNLEDTAIAAQILRGGNASWSNWKRGQDYYPEGELVWLDADTTIRKLTNNQKSLNDFAQKFLGFGGNTPAKVASYTFEDVVAGLNAVAPYDWKTFLIDRIRAHNEHAPLAGLEQGGYRLVYKDTPSSYQKAALSRRGGVDAYYSLGLRVDKEGIISDVKMYSLSFKAGLAPTMKIVAVNKKAYTAEGLKDSLRAAKGTTTPIELIVSLNGDFQIISLDYHEGEKYPQLERIGEGTAYLDEIIKPLTK